MKLPEDLQIRDFDDPADGEYRPYRPATEFPRQELPRARIGVACPYHDGACDPPACVAPREDTRSESQPKKNAAGLPMCALFGPLPVSGGVRAVDSVTHDGWLPGVGMHAHRHEPPTIPKGVCEVWTSRFQLPAGPH